MFLYSQASIHETMIQLVCKNVRLIMDNKQLRKLTAERLQTSLIEIEHILNCQPLTKLTDEFNITMALTPMMLLSSCVDPDYPLNVFLN